MNQEIEKIRDQLAYEAARSDIECFCQSPKSEGGMWWFDTRSVDPDFELELARALTYLNSRNLVVRDPKSPALVRVKDAA